MSMLNEARELGQRQLDYNARLREAWKRYMDEPTLDRTLGEEEGVVTLGETDVLTEYKVANACLKHRIATLEAHLSIKSTAGQQSHPLMPPPPPQSQQQQPCHAPVTATINTTTSPAAYQASDTPPSYSNQPLPQQQQQQLLHQVMPNLGGVPGMPQLGTHVAAGHMTHNTTGFGMIPTQGVPSSLGAGGYSHGGSLSAHRDPGVGEGGYGAGPTAVAAAPNPGLYAPNGPSTWAGAVAGPGGFISTALPQSIHRPTSGGYAPPAGRPYGQVNGIGPGSGEGAGGGLGTCTAVLDKGNVSGNNMA
ncbi:unnamed protein product, partial [Discosporangium mesarthrocarpum]